MVVWQNSTVTPMAQAQRHPHRRTHKSTFAVYCFQHRVCMSLLAIAIAVVVAVALTIADA